MTEKLSKRFIKVKETKPSSVEMGNRTMYIFIKKHSRLSYTKYYLFETGVYDYESQIFFLFNVFLKNIWFELQIVTFTQINQSVRTRIQ